MWSERIKQIRTERGWSIEKLAVEVKVSGRTISRWEAGTNNPDRRSQQELVRLEKECEDALLT